MLLLQTILLFLAVLGLALQPGRFIQETSVGEVNALLGSIDEEVAVGGDTKLTVHSADVKASSSYNTPRNAGNLVKGTRDWKARGGGVVGDWITANFQRNNAWVSFDLGERKVVKELHIYNQNQQTGREVKNILVQTSDDGTNWTDVQTFELNKSVVRQPNPVNVIELDNFSNNHQHWRLVLKSFWGENGIGGLCEVEFYGHKITACETHIVDPLEEDCVCEDESSVCDAGKFCHSGGCQDAKCDSQDTERMFYGSELHGSWDPDARAMSTYIEVPFEVNVTSISWNGASSDNLKYTTTDAGNWIVDKTSQTCKVRYNLNVNQENFFGTGSNFNINGLQMNTYLTVSAEQSVDQLEHGHHYRFTRHVSNLVPVLVNLQPTTQISVTLTLIPRPGGTEFVLFTDAVDQMEVDGKIKITMEVHSENCVQHDLNNSANKIIHGVHIQAGGNNIKSGTVSTFTWKTKTNDSGEQIMDEKYEYDFCVQTVDWEFTPKDLQSGAQSLDITLEFSNRQASSKFQVVATVDLVVADVLGDIGFDGEIETYNDRELTSQTREFKVGEYFWAKIELQNMIVEAEIMNCTIFNITQMHNGIAEKTNMKSDDGKYNFVEFIPANTQNTIVCGAELESPHFHKSDAGKDSELIVEITMQYKQGLQYKQGSQQRRILINTANQGMTEFESSQEDNVFAQTKRAPDRKDLSIGFAITDFDATKLIDAIESSSGSKPKLNVFPNIIYVSCMIVVGLMFAHKLLIQSKVTEQTPLLLEA